MDVQTFFDALWQKYVTMTPQARVIHDAFAESSDKVVNDHVAFRTFNHPAINIAKLEAHFLALGYRRFEPYDFPAKKLNAMSYLPPNASLPRIFLSELRCEALSPAAQAILQQSLASLSDLSADPIECLWAGRLWESPASGDYTSLLAESEYAAWVLVHGLCANHFTISINHLSEPDIRRVNQRVEALGFRINDSGGPIQGSAEVGLEQSSTLADTMTFTFADGVTGTVTTCYYEFAKRYPDASGQLYQGFVTSSADRIFESTDVNRGKQRS